jgi:hypothetical protein
MVSADNSAILVCSVTMVLTGRVRTFAALAEGMVSYRAQVLLLGNLRFKLYFSDAVFVPIPPLSMVAPI